VADQGFIKARNEAYRLMGGAQLDAAAKAGDAEAQYELARRHANKALKAGKAPEQAVAEAAAVAKPMPVVAPVSPVAPVAQASTATTGTPTDATLKAIAFDAAYTPAQRIQALEQLHAKYATRKWAPTKAMRETLAALTGTTARVPSVPAAAIARETQVQASTPVAQPLSAVGTAVDLVAEAVGATREQVGTAYRVASNVDLACILTGQALDWARQVADLLATGVQAAVPVVTPAAPTPAPVVSPERDALADTLARMTAESGSAAYARDFLTDEQRRAFKNETINKVSLAVSIPVHDVSVAMAKRNQPLTEQDRIIQAKYAEIFGRDVGSHKAREVRLLKAKLAKWDEAVRADVQAEAQAQIRQGERKVEQGLASPVVTLKPEQVTPASEAGLMAAVAKLIEANNASLMTQVANLLAASK
jgi:hypothetical protein